MTIPAIADRRDALLREVEEGMRRDINAMEDRVFMGLPACRLFVCQGCGATHEVIRADRIRCKCGTTSAAEVMS